MSSNLFIITAPSGAGKTTLIKKVLEYAQSHDEKVLLSVSHTTRSPRDGEKHGKDYLFISENEFQKNIENGEYIEYANVHGNYYGTPKSEIDRDENKNFKIFFDIDWQGQLQIMDHYTEAENDFKSPPSYNDIQKRLMERGLDSEDVINRRIEGAQLEMDKSTHFKHQITNISLDIATKNLLNIMFRENHG